MIKCLHIGLSATPKTNNGLQRAFRKFSDYREIHTSHPSLNQEIVVMAKEFRPDIVFIQVQTPNIISESTLKSIRPFCGKIVNFTGDVREPLPNWYIETGKLIDLTLCVSNTDVEYARSKGINAEWIQIGFDDEIFNDKVVPQPCAEIVFMANNYSHFPLSQYRVDIATALQKEFGNRFQLYGNGWKILALDCNGSMEQQAAIFRGCKIAISCSNLNHSKYVSDRVLRIMGSGAFCLSHTFQDANLLYRNTEEIITFSSIVQMIELCHHYLAEDEKRNRIAKAGYDLTHAKWTWDCMIKNVIELCGK